MATYYEALQVPVAADAAEIEDAFDRLAMQFHPDRNPGNPEAADTFKKLAEAYEVLRDPERRRLYDEQMVATAGKPLVVTPQRTQVNAGSHFGELFGSGNRAANRPANAGTSNAGAAGSGAADGRPAATARPATTRSGEPFAARAAGRGTAPAAAASNGGATTGGGTTAAELEQWEQRLKLRSSQLDRRAAELEVKEIELERRERDLAVRAAALAGGSSSEYSESERMAVAMVRALSAAIRKELASAATNPSTAKPSEQRYRPSS